MIELKVSKTLLGRMANELLLSANKNCDEYLSMLFIVTSTSLLVSENIYGDDLVGLCVNRCVRASKLVSSSS